MQKYTLDKRSVRSLPEFFILSFSEFFEIPLGFDFFRYMNNCSIFPNKSELNSIKSLTCSNIENREALFNNFLTLLIGFIWIPLISQERQSKVFSKPNGNIVIFDIATIQIYSSKERLTIFKSSNNKVVVVGVLIVSSLIANSSQIVGIILDCEVDMVIE